MPMYGNSLYGNSSHGNTGSMTSGFQASPMPMVGASPLPSMLSPMTSLWSQPSTSYGDDDKGGLLSSAVFTPAILEATGSILDGYSNVLTTLSDAFKSAVDEGAVDDGRKNPEVPGADEEMPGTPVPGDMSGDEPPADRGSETVAENVIFMVPDGFSAAYANGYRYFKAGEEVPVWEQEEMLNGMVETHSASSPVTDSAAAATAYATGEKTYNGAIGVDAEGSPLDSILDLASDAGKATGIVTTVPVTDATVAAFAASNVSRDNQADIAQQYLDNGDLDVIMGGGRSHFLPLSQGGSREDGIDLTELATQQGFDYVTSGDELADAEGDRLLGLFSGDSLGAPIGNGEPGARPEGQPSLAEMTDATLETLSQDEDGFFAVIEEEGTDSLGHGNDAATTMNAVQSFEAAMQVALEFSEEHPNTLVVAAGDHDTGGMSLELSEEANPAVFRSFDATVEQMESEYDVTDADSIGDTVAQHTGLELSDEQIARVQSIDDGLARVLSEMGGIDWTTHGHTAVDVPLYASGAGAERFEGLLDNTEVAHQLADAMGLALPESQSGASQQPVAASAVDAPAATMGVNMTDPISEMAIA